MLVKASVGKSAHSFPPTLMRTSIRAEASVLFLILAWARVLCRQCPSWALKSSSWVVVVSSVARDEHKSTKRVRHRDESLWQTFLKGFRTSANVI